MGFQQTLSRISESKGIVFLEKILLFLIQKQFLSNLFILVICNNVTGGIVTEEIVDCGSHFKSTLVTVFPHPMDPFGVEHTAAEDPVEFLLERPHPDFFRIGRISMVCCRGLLP